MNELTNTTEPQIAYSECYVQPFFTFYNADNMAIMKTFKDKEFDMAIVDPPYGIDWHTSGGNKKLWNSKNGKKAKKWDIRPSANYFTELKRISKSQIIFGGNYFISSLYDCNTVLIWDKKKRGSMFADAEIAFCYIDDFTKLKQMKGNRIIELKSNVINDKFHPTQKPVDLYDWILSKYVTQNEKILDTHLGSGSIAIAIDKANTLDKKNLTFVGIELDPDYFRTAVERFKTHKRQCVLF